MDDYVSELMTNEVITASPDVPLENLRYKMRSRNIHAIPIVDDNGRPVGIISSSDMLDDHPHGTLVARVMTSRVFTIPRYAPIREAARLMHEERVHHLVVTEENRVVGLISSFDMLRAIEEHQCSAESGGA